MTTTRTITAPVSGPTTVDLALLGLTGEITVSADPECSTARIEIDTSEDTGEVAAAVTAADLRWDQRGALVAHAQGHDTGDIGTTTFVRTARGNTVTQSFGTIRGRVVGMVIGDVHGDLNISGNRIGRAQAVVDTPAPVFARITVRVPAGSTVIARTQTADFHTSGALATVAATTESGDITVSTEGVAIDQVTASTQSGTITVGIASTVTADTMTGGVDIDRAVTVAAKTMTGSIHIRELLHLADLSSMTGDLHAHVNNGGARLSANTLSGNVRITAEPHAAADLDARATSLNGHVTTPR